MSAASPPDAHAWRGPEVCLPAVRRRQIAAELHRSGIVLVSRLSEDFGVSRMTILRDLDFLERQGLGARVRGGMISRDESPEPFGSVSPSASLQIAVRQHLERARHALGVGDLPQVSASARLAAECSDQLARL